MMTVDFSLHRIYNLLRWDVYTNGQFYLRQASLMCVGIVLLAILPEFFGFGKGYYATRFSASAIFTVYPILLLADLGHVFHSMRTRQSRLALLTLPVNNLERFVFHVGFGLLLFHVAFVVSVLGADLLHMILPLLLGEGETADSITKYLLLEHVYEPISWQGVVTWGCFFSSFVLVGAWRYKGNIVRTIFLWIALFLLATVLTLKYFDAMATWSLALGIVFFVVIWVLAYWLYKNAEYTTKRNP